MGQLAEPTPNLQRDMYIVEEVASTSQLQQRAKHNTRGTCSVGGLNWGFPLYSWKCKLKYTVRWAARSALWSGTPGVVYGIFLSGNEENPVTFMRLIWISVYAMYIDVVFWLL